MITWQEQGEAAGFFLGSVTFSAGRASPVTATSHLEKTQTKPREKKKNQKTPKPTRTAPPKKKATAEKGGWGERRCRPPRMRAADGTPRPGDAGTHGRQQAMCRAAGGGTGTA
ncbi:hypothetical protein DV515_00004018, partial [Chloebia gouldiae]